MYIKTFKTFLTEESYLYKPKISGMVWNSRFPWVEYYQLPASQRAIHNALNEFGSIRIGITREGVVYMWNAGILHREFWRQNPELKALFNLNYERGSIILTGGLSSYNRIFKKDLKNLMKNYPVLEKAFKDITKTFPNVKYIDFIQYEQNEKWLSIHPPYDVVPKIEGFYQ